MDLIERVQYKAALIVSGCWQGTSRVKLYDELGWESLSDRRWARRPLTTQRDAITFNLRNRVDSTLFTRTDRYDNSFYPYTIKAWKNLENEAKLKPSVQNFKKHLNDFIRPPGHSLYGVSDKYGIKLLTKIRVTFSDLRDHRLNHNVNSKNPLCSCGMEDEFSEHFFLHCPLHLAQRSTLLSKISAFISSDVTVFPDEHLHHILIYGSNVYNSV